MTGGLRYPICFNSNFDDVFNAIAQDVIEGATLSCNFTLQNEGSFDINTAKVVFQKDANATPVTLTKAASLAACGANQWYIPNPAEPAKLSLCPTTCASAQDNEDSSLSVEVGCDHSGEYEEYTFDETYSAACPFDQVPQWGFLSVESTTPGDSFITIQVRTGDTEAELASAPFSDLTTLSAAQGNSICTSPSVTGCPLDVYEALGGDADARHTYVELSATVTPTSDKQLLPSLQNWSLSYSCIDAQ